MKTIKCPCATCKEKELRITGDCNGGFGICKAQLDFLKEAAEYARKCVALHPDKPTQIAIYKEIMKGE